MSNLDSGEGNVTSKNQLPGAGARQLAEMFHELYERLAPQFDYETRKETRAFDPATANGKLMIAVCDEILTWLLSGSSCSTPRAGGGSGSIGRSCDSAGLPICDHVHPFEEDNPASGVSAVNAQRPTDLVSRLRSRLIMVPEPGSESFVPTQPFWVTCDMGEHKAGDSAGLQYVPMLNVTGMAPPPMRVQKHIYVVEPLCEEAAQEIERLRAMLGSRANP